MGRLRAWLRGAMPYKWARRLVVGVIGGTVLLAGIALIFLPGPALIVMPIGLGILGLEFAWARQLLRRARKRAEEIASGVRRPNGTQRNGGAGRPAGYPEQK